jgi:hypothetical protein
MLRQTDTIGSDPFDLRRAWDGTVIFRAFAPEDEEEEPDETGGDTTDETDDGSSGTDDTDDADKGKVRDPDAKNRSDEAAKYRRRLRDTEKALEERDKRLRELEDKDKDKVEILERNAREATERAEKAEAARAKAEQRSAFFLSGAANLVADPSLALMLLDFKDLEPDDDGNYDANELLSRTEELLKQKPVLKKSADDSGEEKPNSSGTPSNGRKGDKKDADRAALEKKFPALARR